MQCSSCKNTNGRMVLVLPYSHCFEGHHIRRCLIFVEKKKKSSHVQFSAQNNLKSMKKAFHTDVKERWSLFKGGWFTLIFFYEGWCCFQGGRHPPASLFNSSTVYTQHFLSYLRKSLTTQKLCKIFYLTNARAVLTAKRTLNLTLVASSFYLKCPASLTQFLTSRKSFNL